MKLPSLYSKMGASSLCIVWAPQVKGAGCRCYGSCQSSANGSEATLVMLGNEKSGGKIANLKAELKWIKTRKYLTCFLFRK